MRALLILGTLAACTNAAVSTGTVCPTPDPTTVGYSTQWDPGCTVTGSDGSGACFGKVFMDHYCTMCHASDLKLSQRNGAPLFHDFDTFPGVMEVPDHIDEQAGIGPNAANRFMPGDRCPTTPGGPLDRACPQPTDAEREQLAEWIACARARTYALGPGSD